MKELLVAAPGCSLLIIRFEHRSSRMPNTQVPEMSIFVLGPIQDERGSTKRVLGPSFPFSMPIIRRATESFRIRGCPSLSLMELTPPPNFGEPQHPLIQMLTTRQR